MTKIQSLKEIYLMTEAVDSECSSFNRMDIMQLDKEDIYSLNSMYNLTEFKLRPLEINGSTPKCYPSVESGHCLLHTFVQRFQSSFQHIASTQDVAGIITTAYHYDNMIISSLLSHMGLDIPLMHTSLVAKAATGNGIFYMSSSSSVVVNAFLHLLQHFNWTRIGVISDNFDNYFSKTTNLLLKEAKGQDVDISPYVEYSIFNNDFNRLIKHIQYFSTKIILLSVGCYKASQILHTAHLNHLTWPEYAWIVHSTQRCEVLRCNCNKTSSQQFLEGVLFINQDYTHDNQDYTHDKDMVSCKERTLFPSSTHFNILHDAINVITFLADTNSSNILQVDFMGLTGRIRFTDQEVKRSVRITQVKDNTEMLQAYYDTNTSTLIMNSENGAIPDDDIPLVRRLRLPLWFATANITTTFIFVTIILTLYLYYRNHAEVKASSVLLSLLIFTGCYLIVLFLVFLTIARLNHNFDSANESYNAGICHILIWLSGIGLPTPLIFATLLVKMLRIYHIFNSFKKISKLSSDSVLALFVLLILSPNLFLLVLFSSISSYSLKQIRIIKTGYVEIGQTCEGDITAFLGLLMVYLLFLMSVVALVATKTRKIRMKEFRDTKKVNALIFVMILVVTLTLSYWLLFLYTNDADGWEGDLILHIGHVPTVLLCQFFLFVPKILPLVRKKLLLKVYSFGK